jgi:hypothetical protein
VIVAAKPRLRADLRHGPGFRVVTWNCRRASTTSKLWQYLLELDADIALLQDYGTVPASVLQLYSHTANAPLRGGGAPRRQSGILFKGTSRDAHTRTSGR